MARPMPFEAFGPRDKPSASIGPPEYRVDDLLAPDHSEEASPGNWLGRVSRKRELVSASLYIPERGDILWLTFDLGLQEPLCAARNSCPA